MKFTVKPIPANDCIPLRSLVLRPGQPLSMCTFSEDHFPTSFHLAVFESEKVVCVGSFLQIPSAHFTHAILPYQLRGMATHPDYRRQGCGQLLLKKAETIILERGGNLLWFNAREKAFPFYEKLGYQDVDGKITVSEFGPHKIMYKNLESI